MLVVGSTVLHLFIEGYRYSKALCTGINALYTLIENASDNDIDKIKGMQMACMRNYLILFISSILRLLCIATSAVHTRE